MSLEPLCCPVHVGKKMVRVVEPWHPGKKGHLHQLMLKTLREIAAFERWRCPVAGCSCVAAAELNSEIQRWRGGTTEERVRPHGSSRAESDLTVGHDKDLGGTPPLVSLTGARYCPSQRNRLSRRSDRGEGLGYPENLLNRL
jgi:hypothetical protein